MNLWILCVIDPLLCVYQTKLPKVMSRFCQIPIPGCDTTCKRESGLIIQTQSHIHVRVYECTWQEKKNCKNVTAPGASLSDRSGCQ